MCHIAHERKRGRPRCRSPHRPAAFRCLRGLPPVLALEVGVVGIRPTARHHGEHEVTVAITQEIGRGETRVGGRLIAFFTGPIASPDEVGADVSRLEACAIDGG